MLRWFNSDPVFWAFLLGVVALADAIGLWAAVKDWPHGNVSIVALAFVTLVTARRFLRVWRG